MLEWHNDEVTLQLMKWTNVFLSTVLLGLGAATATSDSCIQLGFNPQLLKCETCEVLRTVVGDQEFYDNCTKCCIKKSASDLYAKGVIEVDERFISSFQHLDSIVKFVKDKKSEVKRRISIRNKYGSSPYLSLYKELDDEAPEETLSILGWSKDDFKDFVSERLR